MNEYIYAIVIICVCLVISIALIFQAYFHYKTILTLRAMEKADTLREAKAYMFPDNNKTTPTTNTKETPRPGLIDIDEIGDNEIEQILKKQQGV